MDDKVDKMKELNSEITILLEEKDTLESAQKENLERELDDLTDQITNTAASVIKN